jgi:FUN14 domain-containing protein 1
MVESKFENLFYTTDETTGKKKAPTVLSLWTWLVDFVTADIAARGTFIAGFVLGLRLG